MKKTLIKILTLIAVMTLSLSLASVAFAASGALPEGGSCHLCGCYYVYAACDPAH